MAWPPVTYLLPTRLNCIAVQPLASLPITSWGGNQVFNTWETFRIQCAASLFCLLKMLALFMNIQWLYPSVHAHVLCVCVCVWRQMWEMWVCICMWQSEGNLGYNFQALSAIWFCFFFGFGFVSKQTPSGLELTQLAKLTGHQVPRIHPPVSTSPVLTLQPCTTTTQDCLT